MFRNSAWAVSATLLTGALVHAQAPYNPSAPMPFGNPGYPPGMQAPYPDPRMQPQPFNPVFIPFTNGAPGGMPSQPWMDRGMIPTPPLADPGMIPSISGAPSPPGAPGYPMPPGAAMPPGYPMAPAPGGPTSPYYPTGPSHGFVAPAPAEPYLMMPERDYAMQAPPVAMMPLPAYGPAPMAAPVSGPGEPYVLYEGERSLAEVRQEGVTFWAQTNYLHWWTRRDSAPPLVTSGNSSNPAVGTIGQPDTVVLLGGPIAADEFSGVQLNLGFWLDDQHVNSIQMSGFWLGQRGNTYSNGTDANGNPPIAQPVIVGGSEMAVILGEPNEFAGRITFSTQTQLLGAEINFSSNIYRTCGWSFDYLIGFRYLYLSDGLSENQSISVLPGGAGVIPFNGVPLPAGSDVFINDSFNVTNRFYGGQFGAHVNWTYCKFDFDALMKLGLGATTHTVNIDGSTTANGSTLPGGILAQPSNIGQYNKTDFSVVPEFTWTVGYQILPHIRLMAGYTFLYWNQVMRAASQIDRNIDVVQAPSLASGPVAPGKTPTFPANRTDFWAQGFNLGVEVRY